MDRIDQLIAKARMGDITPQERVILQEALLGLAPSSQKFKAISSVIGQDIPFQKGQGMHDSIAAGLPPAQAGGLEGWWNDLTTNDATDTIDPRDREWMTATNAAERDRKQGTLPIGSGVEIREQQNPNMSGGRPNFNPIESFRPEPSMKDQPLMGGPGNAMEEFGYELPEGFTFSDAGPHAVDIWSQNPSAYLANYAEEKGGGANMAAYLENPMKSALAMARMGMLGGGYGDDLFAGQGMGSASELARVESFLNDFSQPGQFVDPQAVMRDVVGRGARTNFEGMKNPQTNMPYTPEEIINITNAAISASATFMGPEGEDWLNSILMAKGDEYINAIARGEIDANTSYPRWLQEQGIGELI